jgi:hypothetical protein
MRPMFISRRQQPMHTYHIPVLGLSYSIDTPLKVARYGISSVISIIEDELIEKMRAYHALHNGEAYMPITNSEDDHRAKRITHYLNLLNKLIKQQTEAIAKLPFDQPNDLTKYFELLPGNSEPAQRYKHMTALPAGNERNRLQEELRTMIVAGSIDVNIMSKVDNLERKADGTPLPPEYSDALSALRGYANSDVRSSVVLSAGYNPRLYSYLENFDCFYPQADGSLEKKIILKVSDYRSALVQGKILGKKGIWVSEFRIESGLNCGGHAFATDGILLGPILEEFRQNRESMHVELLELCNKTNALKGRNTFSIAPTQRITVQGGIGTSNEDEFLRDHYNVDGTGWGSPFLLVPEATNVDEHTLQQLATATKDDYYLSDASPLGVPFNNFRKSTSEAQRSVRIEKNRPGSPCYKKFLASNTEFTEEPICTASREYQDKKIKQLERLGLPAEEHAAKLQEITVKDCLCEGLSSAVLLQNNMALSHKLKAVAICPGPNLAYFSGVHTLRDMTDHIYGRKNLLNSLPRPHMFVNELHLYIDYLKKELGKCRLLTTAKQEQYFKNFRSNLLSGIEYYNSLLPLLNESNDFIEQMRRQLKEAATLLTNISIGVAVETVVIS